MRWRGRRASTNIEDRRGMPVGGKVLGGGLGTIVLVLIVWFMGGDPTALLDSNSLQAPPGQFGAVGSAEENELAAFVGVVLADTEDVWNSLFQKMGKRYQEPNLIMFSGQTQSACGFASAAVGPFYCPADQNVYIDLQFYDELRRRFAADGDFAQAYVIAHEIGHHVQNLLGISDRVHAARGRVSEAEYNQLSVRLELQADYLAGVWVHHAERSKAILERGDLEEALRAAAAIGDDRLQRQAQGYVVPDSFTHGTSEQRMRWFRKGVESGDPMGGNTFEIENP